MCMCVCVLNALEVQMSNLVGIRYWFCHCWYEYENGHVIWFLLDFHSIQMVRSVGLKQMRCNVFRREKNLLEHPREGHKMVGYKSERRHRIKNRNFKLPKFSSRYRENKIPRKKKRKLSPKYNERGGRVWCRT